MNRNAVQIEQVATCSRCGTRPRAFGDLCLSCNHGMQTFERIRLQELDSNRTEFKTSQYPLSNVFDYKSNRRRRRLFLHSGGDDTSNLERNGFHESGEGIWDLAFKNFVWSSQRLYVGVTDTNKPDLMNFWNKVDDSRKASTVQAFYGAQCICDLVNHGPRLCNIQSWGICTALRSSFEVFEFDTQR
jgi:hypothetical protein